MATLRDRFPSRTAMVALGVLFAAGIALRAQLMLLWRPGFLGYPDTKVYLESVPNDPFYSPFWPGGYTMFLSGAHWVSHELGFVVLLQHAMGVASAALLYGAARRLGGSVWTAAVPAAVVLLGGAEIFFEHAVLSEPLSCFLTAGVVYLFARAVTTSSRERLVWAAAAGFVLGLSMLARVSGLFLAPPLALALLALTTGSWRARAGALAAAAAPCLVVIVVFQVAHHDSTGRWGFTTNGVLNLYGRVATWADCTKFDPPAGTDWLCERTPPRLRPSHQVYVFIGTTPVVKRYRLEGGTTGGRRPLPAEGARDIKRFARAAVLGQPLTYLRVVRRELGRIVDPDASPDSYVWWFQNDERTAGTLDILRRDWPGTALVRHDMSRFNALERFTRPPPALMVVVILLALVSPVAALVGRRRGACVFALLALVILVAPVALARYDWRHVVPGLPYLAAAAALGADGLAARAISRFRRASGDPT